jgi:hypothetical protein
MTALLIVVEKMTDAATMGWAWLACGIPNQHTFK